MNQKAFSMAEMFIVIGVVGILAVFTIPQLILNATTRAWSESQTVFELKLKEAMNQMKTNLALTGYSSNTSFVNSFANYMKLVRTCGPTNMSQCFSSSFKTASGTVLNATDLKTGANFKKANNSNDLVGVQFMNGINAIMAYDPDCEYVNPYDNQASAIGCISMIYDLNGFAKPNIIGKDIVLYNGTELNVDTCVTISSGLCVDASNSTPVPIASGSPEYLALKAKGLILYDSGYAQDYWAGAVYACDQRGMRLPKYTSPSNGRACSTVADGTDEACDMWKNRVALNLNTSYWTANELSGSPTYAWYVTIVVGNQVRYFKNHTPYVYRCVK